MIIIIIIIITDTTWAWLGAAPGTKAGPARRKSAEAARAWEKC